MLIKHKPNHNAASMELCATAIKIRSGKWIGITGIAQVNISVCEIEHKGKMRTGISSESYATTNKSSLLITKSIIHVIQIIRFKRRQKAGHEAGNRTES